MSKRDVVRKHRRQAKQARKHGRDAKPRHIGRSGRTGNMHAKKTPSRKNSGLSYTVPSVSPEGPYWTW
jgi:hypothetical protein